MTPKKMDGVIEAVHYGADGRVETVRYYERRGAVFSDRQLIGRDELIRKLNARKVFFTGTRKPFQGASFETGKQVLLAGAAGREVLTTDNAPVEKDHLEGVPQF